MEAKVSIFEFTEARAYLKAVLTAARQKNPRFSVRAWARLLGYRTPSLLINVLAGQRRLNPALAAKIARFAKLSPEEETYLSLLALAGNARTQAERDFCSQAMYRARPDRERRPHEGDGARLIADWHHLAILEMPALKDFRNDYRYVRGRLRTRAPLGRIESVMQRLCRAGMLDFDEHGRLRKARGNPVWDSEVPSAAIRSHHVQMLQRAKEAIVEQSLEERDLRSTKLPLRKEDYPEAKRLVMEFHRALQKLSRKSGADDIYCLNTQLFKLTRPD